MPIPEDIIARVPQWKEAKDLRFSPLGGGITNRNFRVDVGGESFVLRVAGANTELLGIDRENEYLANRLAGERGIAPEVYYYIHPEGYLVTKFVPGRPLPPDELKQPENLRKVAMMLREIHALPPIPGKFIVFRVVEDYTQVARRYQVAFPDNFDWLLERMYEAEEAFKVGALPLMPCHNDLLNENFLQMDGRIYLLDWEYAGMGDIFFDLANLSVNHQFSDEEDKLLLRSYFGEVTEKNWARLKTMKILSDFRESMWGLVQIGISDLDFDFREYADKHFKRMTQNLKDPRWGEWLSIIRHNS